MQTGNRTVSGHATTAALVAFPLPGAKLLLLTLCPKDCLYVRGGQVPGDRMATLRNVVSAAWPLVRGMLQGGRRCSKYTLGTEPSYENARHRVQNFFSPRKLGRSLHWGTFAANCIVRRRDSKFQHTTGCRYSVLALSLLRNTSRLSVSRARGHYSQQRQAARLAYLVPAPFLAYRDTGEAVRDGGWWRMRGDRVGTLARASFEHFVESSTQLEAIFMFDSGSAGGFCLVELWPPFIAATFSIFHGGIENRRISVAHVSFNVLSPGARVGWF